MELSIFTVFKGNNRMIINKIITLPCYIFILFLFSEKKKSLYLCFWCSQVTYILKWSSTEQTWGFFSAFYLFSSFTTCYFVSFFLFLIQVIICFLYFAQIKRNSLSFKDHSSVKSFAVSTIVINLPY